jgi:hypothetical protein
MAASKIRDGGNIIAVFVLSYYYIEFHRIHRSIIISIILVHLTSERSKGRCPRSRGPPAGVCRAIV